MENLIGNTPLIELKQLTNDLPKNIHLYVKLEYYTPSGSVKDRAAWAILKDAINRKALTRDKSLLDSTSGNTGIAYALLGAKFGLKVVLCVPANITKERKTMIKAYGAEIVETDPLLSSDGAYLETQNSQNLLQKNIFSLTNIVIQPIGKHTTMAQA